MHHYLTSIRKFFADLSAIKALVLLALFGLLLYGNTFNNELFWDDHESIVNNQYIRSWTNIDLFFTQNLTAGSGVSDNYWRPLLLTSFTLDYSIAELSPWIYHAQSLFWHVLSAFLVYLIGASLLKHKLASILGALLFIAHPLQTEAVTYVAGRADPMHGALLLGSFYFLISYWKNNSRQKYYILSLVLFILALCTKERAVIFPGVVLLYLLLLAEKYTLSKWKKKMYVFLPYLGITLLYIFLRTTLLHFTDTFDVGQPNNTGAEGPFDSFLLYVKGLALYASLLLWPAKLYMEKSISLPGSLLDPYVLSGIGILLGSIWVLIRNLKRNPLVSFGILWFYGALSPSLHIFPIQGLLYEHWLYVPMIGLVFIISYVLIRLRRPYKNLFLGLLAVSILLLSIRTIIRNNDWQDPVRFYEKNVSLGGYSGRVYTNLGMAYHDIEDHENALLYYNKALKLQPFLFQPLYNRGNLFQETNDQERAEDSYLLAIEKNPYFMPAYNNLAGLYVDEERFDDAIAILNKALDIQANSRQTLYNLGMAHALNDNTIEARKYLNSLLELEPDNMDIVRILNSL